MSTPYDQHDAPYGASSEAPRRAWSGMTPPAASDDPHGAAGAPTQAEPLAPGVDAGMAATPRVEPLPSHGGAVHTGATWAPGAPTAPDPLEPASPTVAQHAPAQTNPMPAALDDDDDNFRYITGRMAKLTRDPAYRTLQRRIANRRRYRARLVELTLALDFGLSVAALVLAQHYRQVLSGLAPVTIYAHIFNVQDTVVLGGLMLVIWPTVFSLLGLYDAGWMADRFSPWRVLLAVGVSSLATSGVLYFLQADRTRWFWLSFTALDAVLLTASRLILRPLVRLKVLRRRVLIVGTARLAIDTARTVVDRERAGLQLVGVVGPERPPLVEQFEDDEWAEEWAQPARQRWTPPRLGEIRDAPQLVAEHEIDLILIALTAAERREASWIISSTAHLPVQVFVLPDVVSETAKTAVSEIDGLPVIGLTESAISGWTLRLKRVMDLALTVPVLVLLSPVLAAIAVAIRMDSPGPALFRQERVGQHNRRFTMLKFRTMYLDAERRAREVAVKTSSGLVHKRRDDPRITRVGRFLRRTSLDELPQLINVARGDMSVVGPRPELPWIVEKYRAWQYRRLLVPQGITGWWQVHGRSDRVLHLHTQDDIYYVRNFSIWLDVKILLLTIKSVVTGKGAF
jgi:exopolysaccharide biosynthesis polyprenyl glycosylphosphotransferase